MGRGLGLDTTPTLATLCVELTTVAAQISWAQIITYLRAFSVAAALSCSGSSRDGDSTGAKISRRTTVGVLDTVGTDGTTLWSALLIDVAIAVIVATLVVNANVQTWGLRMVSEIQALGTSGLQLW